MFCIHCGKEIEEGAKFCPYCGTPQSKNDRGDAVTEEEGNAATSETSSEWKNDVFQGSEDAAQKNHYNYSTTETRPAQSSPEYSPHKLSFKERVLNLMRQRYFKVAAFGVVAVVICFVAFNLIRSWLQSPNRVKETGTYTLNFGDSVEFSSIGATVTFEDYIVRDVDYDNLSAQVDFIIKIDFPDAVNKYKEYSKWIKNIFVNGESAEFIAGDFFGGNDLFLEFDNSPWKYCRYQVSYPAQYTDNEYIVTCEINDDLKVELNCRDSFWELPGISQQDAIDYNQNKMDSAYGIISIDWTQSASSSEFIEGNLYKMTGKLYDEGGYDWLNGSYYILLDDKDTLFGGGVHCYLSQAEWSKVSDFEIQGMITIYGYFDYEYGGWFFKDCSLVSPAGTYTLPGALHGTTPNLPSDPESTPSLTPEPPSGTAGYPDNIGPINVDPTDFDGTFTNVDGSGEVLTVEWGDFSLRFSISSGIFDPSYVDPYDWSSDVGFSGNKISCYADFDSIDFYYVPANMSEYGEDTIYMESSTLKNAIFTRTSGPNLPISSDPY